MYKAKTILATVCARGGSKGVENKNIRLLHGKPLICYSLDILRNSPLIDAYVVSSDSDKIIKIVKDYGFEIYFKRPKKLANDKVGRIEAIRHALRWMEKVRVVRYDVIADLGVATPLKSGEDVENCIKLLIGQDVPNIISAYAAERNPYYNMVEIKNNQVRMVKKISKNISDRRDAPKVYSLNDGIFVWRRDILFSKEPFLNRKTKLYVMPRERSIDIDEEMDFEIAQYLLRRKK